MTPSTKAALRIFRSLGAVLPDRTDYIVRSLRTGPSGLCNGAWSWALETPVDGRCWGGSQWPLSSSKGGYDRLTGRTKRARVGIVDAHKEQRVLLSYGNAGDYDLCMENHPIETVHLKYYGSSKTQCGIVLPLIDAGTDCPEAVTCEGCKAR